MLQLKSVWQKVLMSCHTKFGMTIWSIVILNNFRYDNWVWHMTWWLSIETVWQSQVMSYHLNSVWQSRRLSCLVQFGMTNWDCHANWNGMTNSINVIPLMNGTFQVRYDNLSDCHTVPKININWFIFNIINSIIIHLIILII